MCTGNYIGVAWWDLAIYVCSLRLLAQIYLPCLAQRFEKKRPGLKGHGRCLALGKNKPILKNPV